MTREQAIAFVQGWNRRYNGGGPADEPRIENGISFWCVGHNASHEFSAGVGEDGKLYQRSVGEGCPTEEQLNDPAFDWDEFYPPLEVDVREVADFNGYYGHY